MPRVDLLKNKKNLLTLCSKLLLYMSLPSVIFKLFHTFVFEGPTVCIFKNFIGFDCFGCGITRAIFLVFEGEILQAMLLNWRVSIVLPILVLLWFKQMTYNIKNFLNYSKMS